MGPHISAQLCYNPASFRIKAAPMDGDFNQSKLNKIFYTFLMIQIVVWTITPYLIRYTVGHDTIEAFVWTQHMQWGYDKNPWVVGWLAKLGVLLGGTSAIGYYFIQQLLMALCIWSVWKLAQRFVTPVQALIGAMALEGCLYFTAYVNLNNDNYALMGFCYLGIYLFYLACDTQLTRFWILSASAMALGMMAKYSAVFFLIPMALYLVFSVKGRLSFKHPGIYLGVLVAALICLPNLIWLSHNQYVSLNYAVQRTGADYTGWFARHLSYSWFLITGMIQNFLIVLALILAVLPFKRSNVLADNTDNKLFLLLMGVLPFAGVIVIAIIFKLHLYYEWGVPFIALWGIVFVLWLRPQVTKSGLTRFVAAVYLIMAVSSVTTYVISNVIHPGDYPARKIANYLTNYWHKQYNTPLKFIGGSVYTGGYAAFYSKDKPKVFARWNRLYGPGVNSAEVKKYGAIFVQDRFQGKDSYHFPDDVLKKYPRLNVLPLMKFKYHKANKDVTLLVGILPPQLETIPSSAKSNDIK